MSSPNLAVTLGDPSANLSCELYGYYMRQLPTITWKFSNDVLMNDSVFTITVQDGSHMIQNGYDTPLPSLSSVLTINDPNETNEGSYICSVNGVFKSITLQMMEGRLIANIYIPQYCKNMAYFDLFPYQLTHRHGHINRASFNKCNWTCCGIATRSSSCCCISDNNSCSGDSCLCSTLKKERKDPCMCCSV